MRRCPSRLVVPRFVVAVAAAILFAAVSPVRAQDRSQPPAPPAGDAPETEKVDLEQLALLGEFNLSKLELVPATWTVVFRAGQNTLAVDVFVAGEKRRYDMFRVAENGDRQRVVRLYVRDGSWYVQTDAGSFRYRPYEAVLPDPVWYEALNRGWPVALDASALPGEFVGAKDGAAYFRAPMPPSMLRQAERTRAQWEAIQRIDPDRARNEGLARKIAELDAAIGQGIALRADTATGFMLDFGDDANPARLEKFRWLNQPDESLFRIDDQRWQDRTEPLATGDRHDLAMFNHTARWTPGQPPRAQLVLINLKSRQMHRVPFRGLDANAAGFATTGLGFTPDRQRVIVGGAGPDYTLHPFLIDLTTGENRQLGANLMKTGVMSSGELSPDGKTLAVTYKRSLALPAQILLVDVATGKARPLGDAQHAGEVNHVTWLPDGNGLLFMESQTSQGGRAATRVKIRRIELNGRTSDICTGGFPLVLPDLKKFMFATLVNDRPAWMLADLNGKNEERIGDGLPMLASPVPGPDGKSVMMTRAPAAEGQAPTPVIVDIATAEVREVQLGDGLWINPVWR